MVRVRTLGFIVPLALIGCAGHRPAPGVRHDPNLITEEEIVASHATSAYDAIHKLRGNFLSNRGKLSFYGEASSMPTVYLDEQRFGDVGILATISADVIATIRLYRSWDATTRYGMNNMGGVIAITTRQGRTDAAVATTQP